jgi:DNA repair exonuclease SbcCD ATPase subunit
MRWRTFFWNHSKGLKMELMAPYPKWCADELDRLRAEIARLTMSTGYDRTYYMSESELRAEIAAKESDIPDHTFDRDLAEIRAMDRVVVERDRLRAELAERKERYPYSDVDLDMAIEAETKDLRAELTGLHADNEALRKRYADTEKLVHDLAERNLELRKRVGELEAKSGGWYEEFRDAESRAEQAEAQLASLRPSVAEIERDEAIARAEQAEAQLAEAKAQIEKLTWLLTGGGSASYYGQLAAERNAMRKRSDRIGFWLSAALEDPGVCEDMKRDINEWFAALAPPPAGREGADIDSVPSCGSENDYRSAARDHSQGGEG